MRTRCECSCVQSTALATKNCPTTQPRRLDDGSIDSFSEAIVDIRHRPGPPGAALWWISSRIRRGLKSVLHLLSHSEPCSRRVFPPASVWKHDVAPHKTGSTIHNVLHCRRRIASATIGNVQRKVYKVQPCSFFTARCYACAVLAMGLCPCLSVSVCVCHKSVFY